MRRIELVVTAVAMLALVGCATTSGSGSGDYGGGDGTSCAQAVVVHARNEMAGVRAEYDWIAARYPGYKRGMQSLIRCNGRPADQLGIRTADGQELEVFFDISEYFGQGF